MTTHQSYAGSGSIESFIWRYIELVPLAVIGANLDPKDIDISKLVLAIESSINRPFLEKSRQAMIAGLTPLEAEQLCGVVSDLLMSVRRVVDLIPSPNNKRQCFALLELRNKLGGGFSSAQLFNKLDLEKS